MQETNPLHKENPFKSAVSLTPKVFPPRLLLSIASHRAAYYTTSTSKVEILRLDRINSLLCNLSNILLGLLHLLSRRLFLDGLVM